MIPTPAAPPDVIDFREAISPERFAERVESIYAEHERAASKERKQMAARIELERQAQRIRFLECECDGGIEPTRDALWLKHQEYIDRYQQQLESIDQRLAYVQSIRDERLEKGSALLAALGDDAVRLGEQLAEARSIYARLDDTAKSVRSLLTDYSPVVNLGAGRGSTGGAPRMLLPALPNNTTLLSLLEDLRDVFGPDRPNASRATVALEVLRKFGLTEAK